VSVLRVALLQLEARGTESLDARVDDVLARVDAVQDVDLVVLPELWTTGFFAFDRYAADADRRDEVVDALAALARRRAITLFGGSQIERGEDGALHNTTIVLGPDGAVLGTYRKVHLFGHGKGEDAHLVAGDEAVVLDAIDTRVGLTTCYDLRFPELYRLLVDGGAEVVVSAAAWPKPRVEDWALLTRARALENACFVVACNGCGDDSGTPLGGRSAIVGPEADVLAEALDDSPAVLRAELDLEAVTRRRTSFPALGDRRFDIAGVPRATIPSGD
jgi:predicted amidohydrolase